MFDVEKVFINKCFITLLCTFFRLAAEPMEKYGVFIGLLASYPHLGVDNFSCGYRTVMLSAFTFIRTSDRNFFFYFDDSVCDDGGSEDDKDERHDDLPIVSRVMKSHFFEC